MAGEPQVQVASTATIQRNGVTVAASAKPLYDDVTIAALYEACAVLSSQVSDTAGVFAPNTTWATNRCATLKASVKDNLCNYSYGGVDASGSPAAASANGLLALFGNGNGIPPTGPIALINNAAIGGPGRDQTSQSPSATGNDYNTDGVACLRSLYTGTDSTGAALTGTLPAQSTALKAGIQQVLRTGKLHGVPTILVQGRSDALVPVNQASRAYLGANKNADGASSPTFYYEVTNAQHFDAFLPVAALGGRLVPLHRYVLESLDLRYAHLKNGAPLPAARWCARRRAASKATGPRVTSSRRRTSRPSRRLRRPPTRSPLPTACSASPTSCRLAGGAALG